MGGNRPFSFSAKKRQPRFITNQRRDADRNRPLRQRIEGRRIRFHEIQLGQRRRVAIPHNQVRFDSGKGRQECLTTACHECQWSHSLAVDTSLPATENDPASWSADSQKPGRIKPHPPIADRETAIRSLARNEAIVKLRIGFCDRILSVHGL
jgi:hypothetical protein